MSHPDADRDPYGLVIEDDPDLAKIFSEALRRAGYDVRVFYDGAAGLVELNDGVPSVIVLDLHLPGISGEIILEYIQGDERFERTWIILATADLRKADELRDQADLVLIKPIGFNQLREIAIRLRPNLG